MNLKHLLTKLNPFKKQESQKPSDVEIIPTAIEVDEKVETPKKEKLLQKDAPFIKYNYKIADQDKQLLVSLLASGLTPTEVMNVAREEHNIEVTVNSIVQYGQAEKWQPLMRKIREARMNDLASVSGSHKRVRLERHEKVFEKALKKGDLRNSLAATEAQRKEMEGDTANITLNQQFNILTDEELDHKKKQVMERIKLITANEGVKK